MAVNKLRDFIFEDYYKQIAFVKGSSYYSMKRKYFLLLANKLIERIADPRNAKELSIISKKKKHKIRKTIKNNCSATKNF